MVPILRQYAELRKTFPEYCRYETNTLSELLTILERVRAMLLTQQANLLTEGVHARQMPLPLLVRLTSAAPARRYGLYPQKGALLVGSDADVTIVDRDAAWMLDAAMLKTRWPISPFLGRRFRGRVETTILRGTVVYQDGAITVGPGFGQRLLPAPGRAASDQ
jgi:cytosine/adenosine deaminase-related metal-dependent hydrolase